MIPAVAAALVVIVLAAQISLVVRERRGHVRSAVGAPATAATTQGGPVAVAASPRRPRDPVARLVEGLRTRRWARAGLSLVSFALLAGAVGMLGYPLYTNLYQSRVQARLDSQLASPELRQAYTDGRIETGDSLTRLQIPSLDVDVVVVEGTTASALRAGAGHYADTPLPCETGNVAIAGHRTTYGRPFHHVDRLKPGDEIILTTPIGSCRYAVNTAPFIVAPTELSVVAPTPDATLTLTTCHPKGSAAKRLIVKATLVAGGADEA